MRLEMKNVTRHYAGPPAVEALSRADLSVNQGEMLAIEGPSGSGKSTLLGLLGLMDRPTGGHYYVDDILTNDMSDREITLMRGKFFGFVFQAFHLLEDRTLEENVQLGSMYVDHRRWDRAERARECLNRVGLASRIGAMCSHLSGGERQRVAIARALMGGPRVLFCDEPTGNLDTRNAESVMELLVALNSTGTTVVIVTHDPKVAARCATRIRVIDGRLECGKGV